MKLPKIDIRENETRHIFWKPYINTKLWGGEIWWIFFLRWTIEFDWRDGFKMTDLLVNDEEKKGFWKRIGIWHRRN